MDHLNPYNRNIKLTKTAVDRSLDQVILVKIVSTRSQRRANMADQGIPQLIQAVINAANTAAAANAATAAAAVPPVPPADPFALLPGNARQQPLNYNKSEDMKIFNKAIAGADDKFDLKEANLRTFLDVIKEKARIFDWSTVLNITDANGVARNLLTNFGQLSHAECVVYATAHMGQQTRQAQNDMIMFQYLTSSLTPDARLSMLSTPAMFTINEVPSGVLFLKTLIGRSSVDTHAKVMLIRQEISHLQYKMVELKGDVKEFNMYVAHKRAELLGRGHAADELVTHLFSAYTRVQHEDFLRFIRTLKDKFQSDGLLTADELMTTALARYELVTQEDALYAGNEERIVALISSHKDDTSIGIQSEGDPVSYEAMVARLKSFSDRSDASQSSTGGTNNGNRRRNFNNRKSNSAANEWKKVKPAEGEPHSKTINGRKYNWCKFHSAWTMHHPSDCALGKEATGSQVGQKEEKKKKESTLSLNKALLAMMSEDSCN